MDAHPAAALFPLMSATEYAGLLEDIRQHGLREPIVVDSKTKTILDGRNRYRACRESLRVPQFEWYDGDDPTGYVVSLNLHRRHLNESQRAMIAARLANAPSGARTDLAPIGARSQKDAAKMLNVGERSVERAATVLRKGTAEMVAAVDAGHVAVSAAVQQIAATKQRDDIRALASESRREMQGWADKMTPEERLHWTNEYLEQRGALARLLREILKLGDPTEFARRHAGHIRGEIVQNAPQVRDWLAAFLEETHNHDGHQRNCA